MCLCLCAWDCVCKRACAPVRVVNNINNVPVGSYHRQTDDNRQSDSEAGRGADKQINRNRQTGKTQEADGRTDGQIPTRGDDKQEARQARCVILNCAAKPWHFLEGVRTR